MLSSGLFLLLLEGLRNTIILTVSAAALGVVIAFVAGMAGTSESRIVRGLARVYVEFFRGLSALVLLFLLVFALPYLGLQLNTLWAGVLALALNIGAYAAEVVRGAILAVPKEQVEAAVALNFSTSQRMRLVVLPQALARMLPAFGNLSIELLKASAVVYLVLIAELTGAGRFIENSTGSTTEVYLSLLVLYAILAIAFTMLIRLAERRVARGLGREPTPGLIARLRGKAVSA